MPDDAPITPEEERKEPMTTETEKITKQSRVPLWHQLSEPHGHSVNCFDPGSGYEL